MLLFNPHSQLHAVLFCFDVRDFRSLQLLVRFRDALMTRLENVKSTSKLAPPEQRICFLAVATKCDGAFVPCREPIRTLNPAKPRVGRRSSHERSSSSSHANSPVRNGTTNQASGKNFQQQQQQQQAQGMLRSTSVLDATKVSFFSLLSASLGTFSMVTLSRC
jgi:hypothetical protein